MVFKKYSLILLRQLPHPVKKKIKIFHAKAIHFNTTRIIPWFAKYIGWMLWPLTKYFEKKKVLFLMNISVGIGHLCCELDWFFRRKIQGEFGTDHLFFLILPSQSMAMDVIKLYKHKFDYASANSFLYALCLILCLRYPKFFIDCGLSRIKWTPLHPNDLSNEESQWPKIATKIYSTKQASLFAESKNRSLTYFPMKDFQGNSNNIDQFLAGIIKPLALIHLKQRVVNASAQVTDPETYLPTLDYLSQSGFQLVFVGREIMPHAFHKFDILNYSESKIASLYNDIILMSKASFALITASGFLATSQMLDIPTLFVSSWHLYKLSYTGRTVNIPALVYDEAGNILSASEQWTLYIDKEEPSEEIFDFQYYKPRNATAEEILAGCKETLALIKGNPPFTWLQEQFARQAAKNFWPAYCRISSSFIKKHQSCLIEKG